MLKTKSNLYTYDKAKALKILESISSDKEEIISDVARTVSFIDSVYDEYENSGQLEQVEFAFIIPTRASRNKEEYWEEVYEFLPALKHLTKTHAFEVLSKLPPFRIEMYGKESVGSSGVLIFCPIYNDMVNDIRNKLSLKRKITKRINESVSFAHDRFGVKYVGLGATLPKLTKYGKTIKSNVVTTTGHAGTVYLIIKQVKNLIDDRFDAGKLYTIGFIGGGAIGSASMQAITELYPKNTYYIYDKREKINQINLKLMQKYTKNVFIASSNDELLKKSDLIISAITTQIDLSGQDLRGKLIVDDSQPGSFDRDQVKQAGAELFWVVGHDNSPEKFATRRQNYSYGPHGLNDKSDLWGCEAEVAAISFFDERNSAVKNAVTKEDVLRIAEMFEKLGVDLAEPQSHGQLNH